MKAAYGIETLGPNEVIRGSTSPWRIYAPDGSSAGIGGLIKLAGMKGGWAQGLPPPDSLTLPHESVHLAKMLGLFTESEWKQLVARYAPGITDAVRQEERSVVAAGRYAAPPGP